MPEQTIRAPAARDALRGDALRLAETLGARLCHDLSGLVGTLAGVVEMLAEADAPCGELLQVADQTAKDLNARLRLLRAAWTGDCGSLDRDGIAALLPGITASRRVGLDVSGLAGPYPEPVARVLLNLLLLAAEAAPRGGTVALADGPDGGVLVRVEGPGAGWPAGLAPLLGADPAPFAAEPRGLQAPLLAALAHRAGLRLSLTQADAGAPPVLRLHRER